MQPEIEAFFDKATYTVSYVVADPITKACAIIDPVLDYEPKSGRTSTFAADALVRFIEAKSLSVEWILETHAHADHLTAAQYLRRRLGGDIGIGEHIQEVQGIFKNIFNLEREFATDGSQFDHLFRDNEIFSVGRLRGRVIHTPGHTPACVTYAIGDSAFIGDTLFMPDYGTARTDFPGGSARALYRSIQRIFELPPETRLFMCHDYGARRRMGHAWESTVAEQRDRNIHLRNGVSESAFIEKRQKRDAGLDVPLLFIPAIQINIRAGRFPPKETNEVSYLKIPLNLL